MRMLTFLSSILVFSLCLANSAPELSSPLDREWEELLDRVHSMPEDYIKSAHPYQEEDRATNVDFDFHLKGLPRVDTKKQEIEVDMVLGLTWEDPRLNNFSHDPAIGFINTYEFDPKMGSYYFFPGEKAKQLWVPDIFLDKTPNIRNPIYMLDASSIRIYTDDPPIKVKFMTRLNFDTHCEMNYRFYPFDKQVCSLNIEAFGHGEDGINLNWKVDDIVDEIRIDKAEDENNHLEQYSHKLALVKMRVHGSTDDVGEYSSRLVLEIILVRKLPYFLINLYIPSFLVATIAYCSLYLAPTSKVPRIGMTLVTLLAVNTMINGIKAEMPRVTYITMSDAWLYPITYYCCFCLFEFLVVQHLVEVEKENAAKLTELWSRIIFAVAPFVFVLVYVIVAAVYGYQWEYHPIPGSQVLNRTEL